MHPALIGPLLVKIYILYAILLIAHRAKMFPVSIPKGKVVKPLSHAVGDPTIKDALGNNVKLVCSNWLAHMETYLPEGLAQASMESIAKSITKMNLNCIRFTVSIDYTKRFFMTGREMAAEMKLSESTIMRIDKFNPGLLDLTITDIYGKAFDALENEGVMVIIDNHVSKAGWCCEWNDGNGWPGLGYFNISEWLKGLSYLADTFGSKSNVIGISLRNEPRGGFDPAFLQSVFRDGALAVHNANRELLIIVTSYFFEGDLRYELAHPIADTFEPNIRKSITPNIMYEGHHYSWFANRVGVNQEDICAHNSEMRLDRMFKVKTELGFPFYLSEWGLNTQKFNPKDPWFVCFLSDLLQYDLGSAFWEISPTYYVKRGIYDYDETWALANSDFSGPSNDALMARIKLMSILRNPQNGKRAIVHVQSARCLTVDQATSKIVLGPCDGSSLEPFSWTLDGNTNRVLLDDSTCLDFKNGHHGKAGHLTLRSTADCTSTFKLAVNGKKLILTRNGSDACIYSGSVDANLVENAIEAVPCDVNDINQWFFVV